ncbi:type II toxin-antitoxin system RelE/ParE family toxin [Mesorhizobium sp. RP14(2022)]|uniref:Type II toxin-antitoxin system RelE/ParE family toxin n=1 Tax=Mesorhizobium liriopis TaxID=2953882 RepID=A0ABT1C7G7_9HYPH|nr:type II toxin-antitoxin system RelE/ParE family toxin [Mesorhizobium liriopis]MCO6050423.1 type II toxin-antitoxin system RelE/ParE family toxin [Mesorhizobium liriopis]
MPDVRFGREAENDLLSIYDFIADAAGETTAARFIARVEQAVLALESFSDRGRRRDDLSSGIRSLAFERRLTIFYQVSSASVDIVRVLYAGRDLGREDWH